MTGHTSDTKTRERALIAYLAQSAKARDRQAIERLVRLVSPRLMAHAARLLGEPEQARDAVQAAWVEILHGLPRLRDDAAFVPWALQITSRRVARLIKTRQRDRALTNEWAQEAETATEATDAAAVDAQKVRVALAGLSPAHRATIALFYLEELSVRQVAVAMDVPLGTVKTRLMHARAKLRGILEGDDNGKQD